MSSYPTPPPAAPPVAPAGDLCGDEELARGLVAGDEDCLAAVYRRWSSLVYALARRALGNAGEAEDVTQQVFLGVWRGRAGYRPERGPLGGWIVGITRRKIFDALAARARRGELARRRPRPSPAPRSAPGPVPIRRRCSTGSWSGASWGGFRRPSGGCCTWPSTRTSPSRRSPPARAGRWAR